VILDEASMANTDDLARLVERVGRLHSTYPARIASQAAQTHQQQTAARRTVAVTTNTAEAALRHPAAFGDDRDRQYPVGVVRSWHDESVSPADEVRDGI